MLPEGQEIHKKIQLKTNHLKKSNKVNHKFIYQLLLICLLKKKKKKVEKQLWIL
jgi:hypothetical protein